VAQKTKLTLRLSAEAAAKVTQLAAKQNTSVSDLFSRFVIASEFATHSPRRIGPITRKATGIIPSLRGKDHRRILEGALIEKYAL